MSHLPRLVLAGLCGGSGKTIVSLGLTRAFLQDGLAVAPFKKGPDYIDAAWLALAAKSPAHNLDPFLLSPEDLAQLFWEKSQGFDLAFIEGNRGLFDGGDVDGTCSTSQLARQLQTPVILVLDATKMTRTAAAIIQGCAHFEPGLNLAGVILNRTAGERHRAILRQSIERHTDLPVLGALPKIADNPIPERHMGLISNREYQGQENILDNLSKIVRESCDLGAIYALGRSAPLFPDPGREIWPEKMAFSGPAPRIGYILDAALWFYYRENLEALTRAGAELVPLSLISPDPWPDIQGLYLGGGFPETQAQALAANQAIRDLVRGLSGQGLPIYAECGGFMYLCQALIVDGQAHAMAGVFPLSTTLCPRPQGLGYAQALVTADNPFHPPGTVLKGHEFHYSRCLAQGQITDQNQPLDFCLEMTRGAGMLAGRDGIVKDNTFAAYTHIHALGTPHWAPNFVKAAAACQLRGSSIPTK